MSSDKSTPRVSVVIPNWNGLRWLDPCLNALERQVFRDFEVVIVDNGSVDASVAYLHHRSQASGFPLRIMALPSNIGFAAGMNVGMRASGAEYIAALNNDTEPSPGWLGALVAAADADSTVGSVASTMLSLSEPRVIDTIGDGYRLDGRAYKIGNGNSPRLIVGPPFEVFGACGGAALYRRAMLDDVGMFDERYFAYMEDVDLAVRARLAGWTCLSVPDAVVLHAGSGSSGGAASDFSVRLITKNIFATILKSAPWPLMPFMFVTALFTVAGVVVVGPVINRPAWVRLHMRALLSGLGWAVVEAPAMLRSRRPTQRTTRISARQFMRLMRDSRELRNHYGKSAT